MPLRMRRTAIWNDRPFREALVRIAPHQRFRELVFGRHENGKIIVPWSCACRAIASATVHADDPAAPISDQPGPGLFGGLEYRLVRARQDKLIDVGIHDASSILEKAPPRMFPGAQLTKIGIPMVPAVRSLRAVFERPFHDDRTAESGY